MAGCSGGRLADINSDGSSISIKGKQVMLTEYDGNEGSYTVDGVDILAEFKKCDIEFRNCKENRQGVHEDDLTSYKKGRYYTAYIDTFRSIHMGLNDQNTKECIYQTKNRDTCPLDSYTDQMYTTLASLKFEPITKASFDNCILVTAPEGGSSITVRSTGITIPGVLVVGKGTYDCTQQVDIGDVTVMKGIGNNYDYYQYNDILIKAVKGTDISSYITIHPKKE